MVVGHAAKPAAFVAGSLASPGTLNSVVMFTIVAAAELLLNDNIFACPCNSHLAVLYGLSFLLIPAITLFLADFPWKLIRRCPSGNILCSLIRRPIGLAVTWIIIGSLQRRYVDCVMEETVASCEKSARSTWFQLLGLYVWLFIIIFALVLVLCRRHRASCITGRSTALEMQIHCQMEEKQERVELEKKMKYGKTDTTKEEELTLETLQTVQPGLNHQTYRVLHSEQLLHLNVLSFLSPEDVLSLDLSVAQRCLLRNLLSKLQQNPGLLTEPECVNKVTAVEQDNLTFLTE